MGDILRRLQQQSIAAAPAEARAFLAGAELELIVPPCLICGGRGWLRRDVPLSDPEFGKAQPCTCQLDMSDDQRSARLRRYSNMGVLAQVTFEVTEPDGRATTADSRARFRASLEVARAYAEDPQGWLVLTGASGSGKTHLAAAIANRCMERGQPIFFAFVPDLLDHLRASFNPEHELSYDELFEQVKSIPMLVLDDLGSQSVTPWADEKLFQVLNHRYISGLPTVITTNTPSEKMGDRSRSRIEDARTSRILDLGGERSRAVSGIGTLEPAMRQSMTFESFQPAGRSASRDARDTLAGALQVARAYAADPDGWLVLLGNSGTGKTHLAVAIANQRLERGDEVFFAFVPDLLDHLRYTFSPESRVTYDELFERVKRAPVLVLDDLGSETTTPWAYEKLYQIMVQRHNARLPTIITTRKLPSAAGDPIASRLNDPRVVMVMPIEAPDFRQGGASASNTPSEPGQR